MTSFVMSESVSYLWINDRDLIGRLKLTVTQWLDMPYNKNRFYSWIVLLVTANINDTTDSHIST
jgi:hypothetical protein